MSLRSRFTPWLLMLLSVLCIALSYPAMPFPWLAWFAWVPLFIALQQSPDRKQHIRLFGCWGLAWWCWAIWWLVPAAIHFIHLQSWLALLIWLVICLILSLPYWVSGLLWSSINSRSPLLNTLIKAALITVTVSWLSWLIPGNPAHSQYLYPAVIQLVGLGGVPLLLFTLVLTNLSWANVLQRRAVSTHLALGLITPALVLGYGQWHLQQPEDMATSVTIGAIQPDLQRRDSLDSLYQQTRQLHQQYPVLDLIVWPEFPPAFSWQENRRNRTAVSELLETTQTPLLLNSGYIYANTPEYENTNRRKRPYYNAEQLISASGDMIATYHKQTLVPFFEYLPLADRWPGLRDSFPKSLRYIAGPQTAPLAFSDTVKIAPLICYEVIFPQATAEQVDQGANILINPGSDTWFHSRRASMSHFSLALFRTVEHNLPWLRVTNNGVSAAVSAKGEIITPLSPFSQPDHLVATLDVPKQRNAYSHYGDLFLYALTFFCLCFGVGKGLKRKKHSQ